VPKAQALALAWEIADAFAAKPFVTRRYSRAVLTHEWKRVMHEGLNLGLALKGLCAVGDTHILQAG
jgi:hypothetical protein